MTARNSRNASNSKNERSNRSANTEWTEWTLAKDGTLATACREATTAGTPFTLGMTTATISNFNT
jgi:hypothetical protein